MSVTLTLNGDVFNGFAVLRDLYKTDVVALARWRNGALPDGAWACRTDRPGTCHHPFAGAELKPGQTDVDSLPPYDILDDILHCLIDQDMETASILERGHDLITLERVWRMVVHAEYKRRQAPPGVKLGLGVIRRLPHHQQLCRPVLSAKSRKARTANPSHRNCD